MGANDVNPFLYREYSGNSKDRFLYKTTLMSDQRLDRMLGIKDSPSFQAIVLSGYRTEINTGTET